MRYAVLPLRGEGFFAAAFFGLAAALPGGGFFAGSTSPSSSACPSVRRNMFRTSRTWLARFRTLQPDVSTGGSTVTRSEEHTTELKSLMRKSYTVFCLKQKKTTN